MLFHSIEMLDSHFINYRNKDESYFQSYHNNKPSLFLWCKFRATNQHMSVWDEALLNTWNVLL